MTKPWPEDSWPTPEQWLDWLLSLPRDEQLQVAEAAVIAAQQESRRQAIRALTDGRWGR